MAPEPAVIEDAGAPIAPKAADRAAEPSPAENPEPVANGGAAAGSQRREAGVAEG